MKNNWQPGIDYPEWGDTEVYLKTISKGYLIGDESPKDAYWRVSTTVANRLKRPELAPKFFEYIWNNWLCLATPVLANTGSDRGLPISCFGIDVADSVYDIGSKNLELMMLAKHGGGVGIGINMIRPSGSPIGNGDGTTDGVVPFCKIYDSTILATSQGNVRRGAASVNLNIDHPDFDDWLEIREPKGDVNRQSLNLHQCAIVGDKFMRKLEEGDNDARRRWSKLLQKRKATGEPYIMYRGNVNKQNPDAYKVNGLKVYMTNICCLAGDQVVATSEGPSYIRDLVDGEEYSIWDGKNWVPNDSFEMKGFDKIYEIEISDGSVMRANANHRWFVSEGYYDIRADKLKEKLTTELSVGDYLEYHEQETNGLQNIEGAYIKGFLIGDGTMGDAPILNLHFPKYQCEQALIDSLSEVDIDCGLRSDCIIEPQFSNEVEQDSTNTFGEQRFKKMKGLSARKFKLTKFVTEYKKSFDLYQWMHWSKESKIKFLSGLFDADGTVGAHLQWTNKNIQLVKDIQLMLKTLGYTANIDLNGTRITIDVASSKDFLSYGYCSRLKDNMPTPNRKLTGWRKIVSIKETESIEPVYCPKVESTGKFALANGIMTGNSEITLTTDDSHSFVCCLSSLNLAKYDDWCNTDLVYHSTLFLDGVLEEFIQKAKNMKGFENSVRSAEKGRALGLGVLGWHTYLQQKGIPFEGLQAQFHTRKIFSHMKDESERASRDMARTYGEPLWCRGTGMRNTHLRAIAPTVSNSKLSGNVSAGIEPWAANVFTEQSAKGTFIRKNPTLEKVLRKIGINNKESWDQILLDGGSVQNIDKLDEWGYLNGKLVRVDDCEQKGDIVPVKDVFKTFKEINQLELIRQAGVRQRYVDQSVSLNLAFPSEATPKWINQVHMEAWKQGIKTLYYMRTESVLRGDIATKAMDPSCSSCDG